MRSSAEPSHRPAFAWLAVAALLAAGTLVVSIAAGAAGDRLDWRPERFAAEPWRAWSAALVHLSVLHLGANLAGLALVAGLGRVAGLATPAALAWLVAWPVTQVGLLLRPDLVRYAGLSGVLHAGVAIAGVALVADGGRRRAIGGVLLAGLLAKLVLEASWQEEALRRSAGWDIALAPFAHASGGVAGIAGGLLARLVPRAYRS